MVDQEETDTAFVVDGNWQLDLQYNYVFEGLKGAALRLGWRSRTQGEVAKPALVICSGGGSGLAR